MVSFRGLKGNESSPKFFAVWTLAQDKKPKAQDKAFPSSTSAFFKEDSQSYRIRAPQQMEAEGGITMPASPLVFLLAHIVGFFPRRALSKSWQDSHQHLQDSSLPTIPLSQG